MPMQKLFSHFSDVGLGGNYNSKLPVLNNRKVK